MRSFNLSAFVLAAAVLIGAGLAILPWLSLTPVFEVSEGREGVVVREMLQTGELLLPLRHGEIVPSKPPLFHWMGYGIAKLRGTYQELELRLPSAFAGMGIVMIIALLGLQLGGMRTGILAAAILLTTYGFVQTAMDGRVDMVMSFFVVAAIGAWVSALASFDGGDLKSNVPKISNRTYLLIAVLCGFGILAKGPIGVVLPGIVIVACAFQFAGFRGVRSVIRPAWVVSIVLSLPWYLGAYFAGQQGFVSRQLVFENVSRFFGGTGISPKPFYFYFVEFWSYSAPWSLLFVVYAVRRVRGMIGGPEDSEDDLRRFRATEKLSLTWIVSLVVFLSLSVGKRRAYLTPVLPALALLLGNMISLSFGRLKVSLSHKTPRQRKVFQAGIAVWCIVALGGIATGAVALFFLGEPAPGQGELRQTLAALHQILSEHQPLVGPWYFFYAAASLLCWRLAFRAASPAFLWAAIFSFAALVTNVIGDTLISAKGLRMTFTTFARELRTKFPTEPEFTFIKKREDENFDGFFFLFGRRVRIHDSDTPVLTPGYYLSRRSWLDVQNEEFKKNVEELLTGGKLKDGRSDQVVAFRLKAAEAEKTTVPPPLSPPSVEELRPTQPPESAALHPDPGQGRQSPEAEAASSPRESATPLQESNTSLVHQAESKEAPSPESTSHPQTQSAPLHQ